MYDGGTVYYHQFIVVVSGIWPSHKSLIFALFGCSCVPSLYSLIKNCFRSIFGRTSHLEVKVKKIISQGVGGKCVFSRFQRFFCVLRRTSIFKHACKRYQYLFLRSCISFLQNCYLVYSVVVYCDHQSTYAIFFNGNFDFWPWSFPVRSRQGLMRFILEPGLCDCLQCL